MNKFIKYILSLSIHIKLAVIIFFIVIFISLSTVFIALNISKNQTKEIENELINSTIKTNEEFIISSIFANDNWKLYKFLKALSETSVILNAGIIDKKNNIIAYSNPKIYKVGDKFTYNDSYKIIDITTNNILVSRIILEIENNVIDEMIKRTFFSNLLFLVLAGLFSFVVANLFIKKLLGRFQLIINNMNAISKRQWNQIKRSNDNNDELDKLIHHSILFMDDIKESLEKEENLRLFYHNILKSIDSLIIICDENYTLHYHNNHKLSKYILDEKKIYLQEYIFKKLLLKRGKSSITIKVPDENIKFLFVNIHKINNRIVIYFSDITKLKESEERVKIVHSLEVLGEISSQFAHEIKNLIQPLKLLIPKNTLPDSEDLPMIHATISKMGKQISDYLILGKPVDIVHESSQNIKDICYEIFNIVEVSLQSKNLSLKTNIDYNIRPYLDKKHIELIIINLITNAIEASYEDSDIIISWQQSKNNSTLLKIENSGKTIPENIQKKIFKPFFTTKKDGSGLGLFSIYKIVYTAKGRIEVMSENEHTVFEIFIPNRNQI